MRVHDVMSKAVVRLDDDVTVAAAREKTRDAAPIAVMHNARVAGLVSAQDLARAEGDALLRDVMTRNVATIAPDATVRRAAGAMRGRGVDTLLVIDGDQPVGVITAGDLLDSLSKGEVHAAPPSDRVILRKRGPRKRAVPI